MTQGGVPARHPDVFESIQHSAAVGARGRTRRFGAGKVISWIVFIAAMLYFFLPLIATLEFAMRAKPEFAAFTNTFKDAKFFGTLGYSFFVGLLTIIISTLIIVPTAYWVRLRIPRLRPVVEFFTLMPFVVPPIVFVFGLIRSFSRPPLPLAQSEIGNHILLVGAYTILSFPYMYRAVDSGLRTLDIKALTEAGQSLGSGTFRILWSVIFPNLRIAILSGAFLTLAIVIGEFTIAVYLNRPAFGPYLQNIGQNKSFEPAAVSLISFALTWIAMGIIAFLGSRARGVGRVEIGGAH